VRGRVWAIDNGAFSGLDYDAFVRLLGDAMGVAGCKFVAAPDVVGNCDETLRRFKVWGRMIRALGFPVALVAQDGLTVERTPWDELDALFIGGSTEWKMSREVDTLLGYAAALGKWRHVGRVNTRRRIKHFLTLADSIDGSGFSRWPKRIKSGVTWIEEQKANPRLREV
jgi:hypothetical protein